MSNVSSTSELTTKEIVEQAISDYHESILPYLNGMVPTIANKFSKSDLMSYDEKIVGCAPDGKPLYQKTITKTLTSAVSDLVIPYSDLSANVNASCIISSWGRLTNADGGNVSLNFPIYFNNNANVTLYNSTDGIHLGIGTQYAVSGANFELTFQYTKTTDEAIAIGSDTDYSTTEKIVGTNTDGKPVYQKTIELLNLSSNNSTWQEVWNGQDCQIIDARGWCVDNNEIGTMLGSNIPNDITFVPLIGNNRSKLSVRTYRSNATSFNGQITVQYTKTSD